MGIKTKHTDPTLNSFATDDLIINVRSGSLFFKSNTKLYKLQGDDQSTTDVIEFSGLSSIIQDTDGNVGIGTTTPFHPLHVNGNARVKGNLMVGSAATNNTPATALHIKSSGTNAKLRIEDSDSSNQYWDFLVDQGNGLYFNEDTDTRVTFMEGGNVGIGTTNPGEKLEVVGTIKIPAAGTTDNVSPGLILTSNDDFTYTGTSITDQYINHYGFGFHNPLGANPTAGKGAYISGYFGIDLFTAGNNRLHIAQGGNVGIGTADPTKKLTVAGDISSSGQIYSRGPSHQVEIDGIHGSGPRINMGSFTDSDSFMAFGAFSSINNLDTKDRDFHLYGTNTTTGFYFDESAGNFGIGTTSPVASLHVSGSSMLTGGVGLRPRETTNVPHTWLGAIADQDNQQTSVGAIVIDNIEDTNSMMQIVIRGNEYESGKGAWKATLGCYWYTPDNDWHKTSLHVEGNDCPVTEVSWAKTSDTTPTIILGTTSTTWNYPQIWIDVYRGYNGESVDPNWDINFEVTDLSAHTVQRKRLPPTFLSAGAAANAAGDASGQDDNTFNIRGAIAKGSGTFKIDHPNPLKTDTHYLQHSFVESPTGGDNIYRWTITTNNNTNTIILPDYYKFLNKDDMVWISPLNHFGRAYGTVNKEQTEVNITSDTDGEYNVLLIGTRKDPLILRQFKGVEIKK